MKIAVIDGQGGGIGKTFISKAKNILKDYEIVALGITEKASVSMLKKGAKEAYFGEEEIINYLNNNKIDYIVAPIGVLIGGGINGEVSPVLSNEIFNYSCAKYIIPLKKHGITIVGIKDMDIKDIISEIIKEIKENHK
ncbi:MAG: DUF3842 family protein [Clostridiaceae bacterium]